MFDIFWKGFASIVGILGVIRFGMCVPEEREKIILVTTQSAIYISESTESDFRQFSVPGGSIGSPYGIDVDVEARLVFWVDRNSDQIKRASLSGKDYAVVTTTGASYGSYSEPVGLAIDANEKEIYWTDTATDSIGMVKYDGSGRRIVAHSQNPKAIVLNARLRKLYWVSGSYIKEITCSGERLGTLRQDGYLSNNPGIAMDTDGTNVYWCRSNTFKSQTIPGGLLRSVVSLPSSFQCQGMAWLEGEIYWLDVNQNSLGIVNEETGQYRRVGIGLFSSPRNVFVGRVVPELQLTRTLERCDIDQKHLCEWSWTNLVSDDFDWTVWNATILINSTTSISGHGKQNRSGDYISINTTNTTRSAGDDANIVGTLINVTLTDTPKCFRFWYQMHDVINGSLKVFFLQTEPKSALDISRYESSRILLWSKYGSQPNEWVGAEMAVRGSGTGRIIMQAIVGDPTLNSVGIEGAQYGECRQASRLVCGDTSMTMYLDRAILGISIHDDVTLASSSCRGYDYDPDTIVITTAYNKCGTTARETDDVIVFTNQASISGQNGIRSADIRITFNCSLSRSYHVEMTYLAHQWMKYVTEEGFGNFTVGIHQYSNDKFHEPYPSSSYPHQVDEGDVIYMATAISMVKDTVAFRNTRCWATESPDPTDTVQEDLVLEGCPGSGGVQVMTDNAMRLKPFSFKAFSFAQEMELIYVHCDVTVCRQSDASMCSSDCSPNQSRARRESRGVRDAGSGPHTVSQGPFISKRRSDARDGGGLSVNGLLLSALVCTTILLVAAVAGIAISLRLGKCLIK